MKITDSKKQFISVSKEYVGNIYSAFEQLGMKIPSNLELENFVIANIFYNFKEFASLISECSLNIFYSKKHRYVYHCLEIFYKSKKTPQNIKYFIDSFKNDYNFNILFNDEDEFRKFLDDLKLFVNDISLNLDKTNTEELLIYNIKYLKEYHMRRDMIFNSIQYVCNIVHNAQDFNIELNDIVDETTKYSSKVFDVFESLQDRDKTKFFHAQEVVQDLCDYFTDVLALKEHNNSMIGLPSGFTNLDNITKGFRKGDLIIIAGRPSMGKTAFALNIASNVAYETDKNVAIFSIEMSALQLMQRFLVSKLTPSINVNNLKNVSFDENDLNVLSDLKEKAISENLNFNVYINEMGNLSPFQIERKLEELQNKLKDNFQQLDLVIIDYLQLMSANNANVNRNSEISEITRRLKLIAKQFQVPVILLSQLSRDVEKRADKRPVMADLRDSGSIEQDADLILMLYRPDYYKKLSLELNLEDDDEENNNQNKNKEIEKEKEDENPISSTEIIISKHRNGETGIINLNFNKNKLLFENIIPQN